MASPIGCNQNLWRSQGPFFPFLLSFIVFRWFWQLLFALRIFSQTTVRNTIPKIPRSHYFSKPDFEQSPSKRRKRKREGKLIKNLFFTLNHLLLPELALSKFFFTAPSTIEDRRCFPTRAGRTMAARFPRIPRLVYKEERV